MTELAESSVLADVASAVVVNVVALVVGYPIALILPVLVMILPFGVFWAYLTLVGIYAVSQFRKGRKRRAVLAGALAAVVLVFFAANLRIA